MVCCKCNGFLTRWPDPQKPVYKDEAGLQYCVFHAPAHEKRSTMNGPILSEQDFQRLVMKRIRNAHADGIAECDLRDAIFPYMFSLSPFKSEKLSMKMRFEGCEFFDGLLLNQIESTDEMLFSWAKFHGDVTIWRSSFRGKIDFSGATFRQSLHIGYTKFFNAVDLSGVECHEKPIKITKISEQSLSNIIFDSTIVKNVQFCGINQWPHELGLHKHITPPTSIKDLEELYRAMKQRAAEALDQPQVSHWHFREKLMQLKGLLLPARANALIDAFEDDSLCDNTRMQAWWELFNALSWRMRRSLLFLYWTSSGFGERPRRAAACLVILAFLPLLPLIPLKLLETGWSLRPDALKVGEVLAEWVRCLPLVKLEATVTPAAPIVSAVRAGVSWLFQVAIALQAGLFALAVRNRFRR